MNNTSLLALKNIKRRVGLYCRVPCHGYAVNCQFVYLATPWTHLLLIRKQNLLVLINDMQQQNVKFMPVQINMKQVSYSNAFRTNFIMETNSISPDQTSPKGVT